MADDFKNPTPEMLDLIRRSGSNDPVIRAAAERLVATAVSAPIRQGILDGDNTDGIFVPMKFDVGSLIEFPLDFVNPGSERDFIAYTAPNAGHIPYKNIEGDILTVSTYDINVALDWNLKYARDARWDIISRAKEVIQAMVRLKMNRDAWRLLIAVLVDRGLMFNDSTAPDGFFTKRLLTLLKTGMWRNGGGNLSSTSKINLTDLYLSPEAIDDVFSWDFTQIPDAIRVQIYNSTEGIVRLYGVNLNPMSELGASQYLTTYYSDLGGTFPSGDTELVVGLDRSDAANTFVNPIREAFELHEDPVLLRSRRQGFFGWQEHGFAVLDNRRVVGGTF